jgi:hypothetical protein
MYGCAPVGRFLAARPRLCAVLARGAVAFECLFPLALVLPLPMRLGLLAAGLLFHLLNGLFMGLNTFFWSFTATYPAILYCAASLEGGR